MTERLVGLVPIGDLAVVRVKCLKCETTFEIPVERLGDTFERQACPKCNARLGSDRDYHQFAQLERAIRVVRDNPAIAIEFVVAKS